MEESDPEHRCKNFKLCRWLIPFWKDRCQKCNFKFKDWNGKSGEIEEYDSHICSICFKKTTCFEHQQCDHPICVDCFRIIYFDEIDDNIIESKIGPRIKSNSNWFKQKEELIQKLSRTFCLLCK